MEANQWCYLFLSLTHCKELQLISTKAWSLSQLHQVTSRVRTGAENEDYWRERVGLLKYRLKTDHRRRHIFLAHSASHEVRDGQINSIHTETAQEKKTLKVCQFFFVTTRKRGGFWCILVTPLKRNEMEVLSNLEIIFSFMCVLSRVDDFVAPRLWPVFSIQVLKDSDQSSSNIHQSERGLAT